MNLKRILIKNLGLIESEEIELNKPLILFYGEIRQGKTTILNAVKWALGAPFPDDVIRHGEKEASATIEFEGGSVGRSWYRSKEGGVVARPVEFIRDGKKVNRPMDELRKFLNPFLLDQDYLSKMTERERKMFFVEQFAVDTGEIEVELSRGERRASEIRASVKAFGEIDVTPVELVDVSSVTSELETINADYAEKKSKWRNECAAVTEANRSKASHNVKRDTTANNIAAFNTEIGELEQRIVELNRKLETAEQWLKDNPVQIEDPAPVEPVAPDTSELQNKLNEASATKVRHENYQKNLSRQKEKEALEKELSDITTKAKELKASKLAKLKDASDKSGIEGLAFEEDGTFVYEGTSAGMLSTSQVMRLSNQLSALFPSDFGVELIDRGESLGKSIFTFIERAKRENKTIMASIVGESPADVPENVGVFVVESGKLSNPVPKAQGDLL
jgi:DNA repair exonuclease SbcCD ATPase subunit